MRTTRRALLAAAAAAPLALAAEPARKPSLCVFSKHFPWLEPAELGDTLHGMGIPGVDLTVRPGGHVPPEKVESGLRPAVEALRDAGVEVPMISTGLVSLSDPAARPTLYSAAAASVPFFKLGYQRYPDGVQLEATLARVQRDLDGLAGLAEHAKIQGGFHNHSGAYVGAAVWDAWTLLEYVDPRWMGFYFDPCHATIEGGKAGWEIAFHRIAPRVKMVACKDFYWEKAGGEWRATMCPLGQGMVDYPKFFRMLAASGFNGPISLHVEYELEGQEATLAAVERDFGYLRRISDEAYSA